MGTERFVSKGAFSQTEGLRGLVQHDEIGSTRRVVFEAVDGSTGDSVLGRQQTPRRLVCGVPAILQSIGSYGVGCVFRL